MLTRRHYEAIATIIGQSKSADTMPAEWRYGCDSACLRIATNLADLFATDNPRFDRARFLKACGVAE